MIPRNWRLQQQRYRLAGKVCEHCNEMTFPPRAICPRCEVAAQTPLFGSNTEQVVTGIPVEVVARNAQNGGGERVIVYGYQSRLTTRSIS